MSAFRALAVDVAEGLAAPFLAAYATTWLANLLLPIAQIDGAVLWAKGSAYEVLAALFSGTSVAFVTGAGVSLAAALAWLWWRRKKDRRKALAALGAKSLARIAAMVTRMRERPARPVLIPSPGGAR